MSSKTTASPTLKLLSLVGQHKLKFALGMAALGLGSGVNLVFPDIIRRVLDSEHLTDTIANPTPIGLQLIGLFAFQCVCFYFRILYFGAVGQEIVRDLRQSLYGTLIEQDVAFFDRSKAGDLVSRIGSDTALIQDAVSVKLSVFIRYSIQVAAGIAMMLFISIKLSLLILLTLPILVFFSIFLGKRLKRHSKAQQTSLGESIAVAEETFTGVRIVKAFNAAESEKKRFGGFVDEALKIGLARNKISAFFQSFVSFLMNVCIVVLVLYGTTLVSVDELSVGNLTAFLLYGLIVAVSFSFVAGGYAEFVQSLGAAERIFEQIDALPKRAQGLPAPKDIAGSIQFSDVSFAYPLRPESPALANVSFEIPAGSVTALVGPSGSGKSTIVSLLLKFYEPSSGKILVDGQDFQKLDPLGWRDLAAIVPQDALLFGVSIAENLRYGKPSATEAELLAACKAANLEDFVRALPDGLNTRVGERGVQLSGGERQRVAIARAMLRNPRLLILDEATSALDSRNEFMVQSALAELMRGRTCLVIAHRLSTIKAASQILVLEQGHIIQRGTHSSLSASEGLYKELVDKQLLGSQAEAPAA